MWCLRAAVGLLVIYGYLAEGERPYFNSTNFKNVLQWYPVQRGGGGGGEGEPILYSVFYRRDEEGQDFRPKMECQNITSLSCDLTAETPSMPMVCYAAQVRATGRTWDTYRWLPIRDTILGAPNVSPWVSGPYLHLNVTLPPGPGDTPLLELLNRSRPLTVDPVVSYTLNLTQPSWAAQVNESHSGQFKLRLKNNDTTYCGYVFYKPSFPPTRPPSNNTFFCVLMPSDPLVALPWFLVLASLVVVPVIMSSVFVYRYTHPRKKPCLPPSLQDIGSFSAEPRLLRNPDPNPRFSVLVVCPVEERKLANHDSHRDNTVPIKQKPKQLPQAQSGYFPQCDPCDKDDDDLALVDRSCSSCSEEVNSGGRPASECQSSTTQSSISYAHLTIHVPCEAPFVDREPVDKTVKTSNPDVVRPVTAVTSHMALENPTEALDLLVVRNAKGELTLPMLAFQPQADRDEEEEDEDEKEEEKPLLVDVVAYKAQGPSRLLLSLTSMGGSEDWEDSSFDQSTANTTPTQLSPRSDGSPTQHAAPVFSADLQSLYAERDAMSSGYKQNWINVVEDTCGYGFGHQPWTQPPEEEVGGAGEEEQGDGQVFLGGWVVRFQN